MHAVLYFRLQDVVSYLASSDTLGDFIFPLKLSSKLGKSKVDSKIRF